MWPYLKALWNNEGRFLSLFRGLTMAAGAGLAMGHVSLEVIGLSEGAGAVIGVLVMGGSSVLRSNPGKPVKPKNGDTP